jgi:hypothetical protein
MRNPFYLLWKYALGVLVISIVFPSCYTYKIYPKEHRNYVYTGERQRAYVQNPEAKAFRVFQAANIFQLTSDSTDTSALQIKLYPVRRGMVCGQAIVASMITLGQLPVYLPDRYYFNFDEIKLGTIIHRQFDLQIATRYWFWDMFTFKKHFQQKAGQSLLAKYYTVNNPSCTDCQQTAALPPSTSH